MREGYDIGNWLAAGDALAKIGAVDDDAEGRRAHHIAGIEAGGAAESGGSGGLNFDVAFKMRASELTYFPIAFVSNSFNGPESAPLRLALLRSFLGQYRDEK